jgi:glucosylceramidase
VAERYGRSIINDLNRWTVGWIDWNLVLDDSGGPNHVGNLCSAPLLVDRSVPGLMVQPSYHYLGHFARFVRPGARRVLCAATIESLECTAFLNPDGSCVAVVMNRTEDSLRFALRCSTSTRGDHCETAIAELPPRSIASFVLA